MAKFCKNCGTEMDEGSLFCDECGTRVGESNPSGNFNNINNDYNPFNLYKINMIDGEKLIRNSEIHMGCLIVPGAIMLIGFVFSLITASLLVVNSYYPVGPFEFMAVFLSNPLFVFGLIWLIVRYLAYTNNDLILTNKRVFGKCGLISTTQMQCPLKKINTVTFTNGLMGKLLGYGTVRITSGSTNFKFRFIRDGQTLYSDIFHNLEIAEKEKIFENAEAIADAIGRRID